jgi:hypothetical protein
VRGIERVEKDTETDKGGREIYRFGIEEAIETGIEGWKV